MWPQTCRGVCAGLERRCSGPHGQCWPARDSLRPAPKPQSACAGQPKAGAMKQLVQFFLSDTVQGSASAYNYGSMSPSTVRPYLGMCFLVAWGCQSIFRFLLSCRAAVWPSSPAVHKAAGGALSQGTKLSRLVSGCRHLQCCRLLGAPGARHMQQNATQIRSVSLCPEGRKPCQAWLTCCRLARSWARSAGSWTRC